VKLKYGLLIVGLFLTTVSVSAENKAATSGSSSALLGGAENLIASKVYIVQLTSPSAGEHYATFPKSRTVSSMKNTVTRPRFEKNSSAIRAYTAKLDSEQQKVLKKVGPGTEAIYSYKYGLNGFAVRLGPAQAQKMRELDEVLNVWEDEIRPLATTDSRSFLGLFDSDGGLRTERGLDGDGVIIGIIDSGIAPGHPSLSDSIEAPRPSRCRSSWGKTSVLGLWLCKRYSKLPDTLDFEPPENWNGTCESGDQFEESDCNNKLIGARWFVEGADQAGAIDANDFRSPRDADGHGTHTATTAAGIYTSASIFGTLIGDIEGMAPRARVAAYKACWLRPFDSRASCNSSDLVRAIDAAVADGVDIISYSVGNSKRETIAPDDVALMVATKAGVLAVVAAGNEGPALATVGSPAGAPWVITAAASSRAGESSVESMEINSPASIAGRYATREALFSPPLSDRDPIEGKLVLVDDGDITLPSGSAGVSSDGCQALVNGSEVSGNIALMQRSGCLFTEMVKNAEDAGAIAVLVYNIAGDPIVMFGENGVVDIPALMIGQEAGNLILAELDENIEVNVTLEKSLLIQSTNTGNVMASFSARGPGPNADILKPDVSAPGINIIAGFTADPANATPGENFAYLSGTSMSTPHVAGVAALLLQAHPEWTPAAIKSALMTTARQDLRLPDDSGTTNPFDYGAGHIVPNDALEPGLVYDVSDDEYDAYACGIESPAVTQERCEELAAAGLSFFSRDLNQPSIAVSRLINEVTVTRRVTNPGDEAQSFNVAVSAPPGISIDVVPASISVGPGQSASFDVTIRYVSGPLYLWQFGSLTWVSDDHEVRSSIAIRPAAVTAPREVVYIGGSGSESFPVTFGYNGSYAVGVHGLNLPIIRQEPDEPRGFVDNDPTQTFTRRTSNGVTQHIRVVPPNQLFLRFSLFDALTDGDDDLDLYVYYCGLDGSNCSLIDVSGSQTSQEQINIYQPTPGVYGVYVHGFETDQTPPGGPGAYYDLLTWSIGEVDDVGNMTASGPALVGTGTTAEVTVNWSGLLSNTLYLGGISHISQQALAELTIVTIGN
jgi:subtilisin family serine protease